MRTALLAALVACGAVAASESGAQGPNSRQRSTRPCAPPYLRSVCTDGVAGQDTCQIKRHAFDDASFATMFWKVGPTPAELEAEANGKPLPDDGSVLGKADVRECMDQAIEDWRDACRRMRPISQEWDDLSPELPPPHDAPDTDCARCPEDTMYVDWVTVDLFQSARLLDYELAAFVPRRDRFQRLVGGMIIVPELPKLPDGAREQREGRYYGSWDRSATNLDKSTLHLGVVLSHEYGHSIGLGNTERFHSLMFANAWARNRKTTPQACDCAGLNAIYGWP